MRKTKHRMTKQRRLILKVLKNTDTHPTADWIYEQVKKEISNISLGTVYRNLKLLSEMGKIQVLDYGSSYSRFDGNPQNHYHFTCNQCERIFDLDIPHDTDINEKLNKTTPFAIKSHRMEFYGLCPDCQKKNNE
ncbi:MAG: Fur family transcriptional regulator [Halanaerobiaceae bacterium]